MTREARHTAHGYWFALFGAHSDPKGRVLCMATALAFLAFPVADLLRGELATGAGLVAAAGIAVFAAAFLRLFWILPAIAQGRRAEGMALLGVMAAPAIGLSIAHGDNFLALLVYMAIGLALALPTGPALAGIAAVAAVAAAVTEGPEVAAQVIAFGLVLAATRRMMELVRELEATRAQVAELAASEERLRISRDLHDLLGHNLSVVALKSQLARRLLRRDTAEAEAEMRDVDPYRRASRRCSASRSGRARRT